MSILVSACLWNQENNPGCFTIMFVENDIPHIINVKWYASIYQDDHGYNIRHPDCPGDNIKEVLISRNITAPNIADNTLYLPNNIKSLNYCIQKWCETYDVNVDYFNKKSAKNNFDCLGDLVIW